jgi:hypothetical protein
MQEIEIVTNPDKWQSINEYQESQGDKWHKEFSPEVHVLVGTLVPIVLITHLVVRWLIGVSQT